MSGKAGIKTCGVQSPGPAGYGLPTLLGTVQHDVRRKMLPAYSFGYRPDTHAATIGPGPGSKNIDRVTRYGRETRKEYSLGKRLDIKDTELKPGPAHYNLMNMKRMKEARPPEYSMGARIDRTVNDRFPAPNLYKYSMNYKKTYPIYSMGARLDPKLKSETPGPDRYPIVSKNVTNKKAPAYFLGARTRLPGNNTLTPAPNNYPLMNFKPGNKQPEYSFGERHTVCSHNPIVPGDN